MAEEFYMCPYSRHEYFKFCLEFRYPNAWVLSLSRLMMSLKILGGPVGVYLFGLLNDRAGRRTSYFSCLATLLIGSFLTALSSNFWMWTVSRVIVGMVSKTSSCMKRLTSALLQFIRPYLPYIKYLSLSVRRNSSATIINLMNSF